MSNRSALVIACAALLVALSLPSALAGQDEIAGCLPGTAEIFSPTGTIQTYNVPPGTSELTILAIGATGGTVTPPTGAPALTGGHAASLLVEIPFGVPGPLNVVVGIRGEDATTSGGGGGGGSFVFTPANQLLVAAGGGGGAGVADGGFDAQLTQGGLDGGGAGAGAGGTGGQGGGGGVNATGGNGGGGGGFLSPGVNGVGTSSGEGGHRISSPGDAEGGAGVDALGGFGGGGGSGDQGGGGGGGYSGGGGSTDEGGGGGGSLVAAGGTVVNSGISVFLPGDGFVEICVSGQSVLAIPTLGWPGLALLALTLAMAGGWMLSRRV